MADNITSTDTSILDNLDLIKKIQTDIRSEWEGDQPGINFFLLLGALLLFVLWALFSVYFFSRKSYSTQFFIILFSGVAGLILGIFLKRLLPFMLGDQQKLEHFSIGSFSLSILAGKLMFRDVIYVTEDNVVRINDGYFIFSFWRSVPKKADVDLDKTRGL
jgi:hypothetical protein